MSDESTAGLVAGADAGADETAEADADETADAGADETADAGGPEAEAGDTALNDGPPPFRVVFDRGVTVTKWSRVWEQRLPGVSLSVAPVAPGRQTAALFDGDADVSFVRHPFDRDGLSAIELYSEKPVVGVAKDHPVSVFDEVDVADLAAEHLLQDPAEVVEWRAVADEIADGSRRPLLGIHSLDDAVEQVAAGVGIVILPQSIARLHTRKDVVYRPVTGVAETPVSLVWVAGEVSPLVEQFIGIVRGRSASSSRDGSRRGAAAPAKKIGPVAKAKAKAKAAREAEEAASGRPAQRAPRKKTQSEQANKAHARKRKFGGKR